MPLRLLLGSPARFLEATGQVLDQSATLKVKKVSIGTLGNVYQRFV